MTEITFRAAFPAIQGAIKRHGGGDGLRIQLDIPECDLQDAIALMALTNCVLRVTIAVDSDKQIEAEEDNATLEAGTKRKSAWATT